MIVLMYYIIFGLYDMNKIYRCMLLCDAGKMKMSEISDVVLRCCDCESYLAGSVGVGVGRPVTCSTTKSVYTIPVSRDQVKCTASSVNQWW